MLTIASALAETNVYQGFRYNVLIGEAQITGYTDSLRNASGGEISVPGYIPHEGQYLPTSVGTAFKQCDWLKSVTIEYGCKGLGLINVVDVSTIYSVILGTDMTYADSADVDGNGIVNVVDVSEVYKIIIETK